MNLLVDFKKYGAGSRQRLAGLSRLVVLSALMLSGGVTVAQTNTSVVEAKTGDTFSSIAARFTGNPAKWRSMYRADLSGLPDPNRILVGMRFEVATAPGGERYLRLAGSQQSVARSKAGEGQVAPTSGETTPANTPVSAAPLAVPPKASAAGDTLTVGILPNIAAATIRTNYQHLVQYLEKGTARKVTLVVPKSFKDFYDGMLRGDYDVAIAAPNFARVAQVEGKMVPMLIYQPQINALFVAPIDSTVKGPRDVRERVVAFANPTSLVAMYGQQWFKQNGIDSADYEARAARTDLGVGRMLLSGDAAAAIMSNGEFRSIPADELSRLKIVEIFARIPNFVLLVHPRLEGAERSALKAKLSGFFADVEDGVPFAQSTGVVGFADVDDSTMRELDAFVPATRRAMSAAK